MVRRNSGGSESAISLAIAGDVMLGRLVDEAIAQEGYAYPWGNILPLISQADLFLVNLECALTSEKRPWHNGEYKAFYFRAEPPVVNTLKIGRVNLACLANNHIGDFGEAGLLETLRILDEAGIAHAGAGRNLTAARAPAYLAARGVSIGVVAFTDYPAEWAATPTSPSINYTPASLAPEHFDGVRGAIAAAREGAEVVIFTIHWGPNMRSAPTPEFRDFAHRVIDAGADIFWGHSAHLVQCIEVYRGKPILYDTGDFIDDYAVGGERNDLSALFLLSLSSPPSITGLTLVPVKISQMQVNLAVGAERDWFTRRLTRLCQELGTTLVASEAGLSLRL